jgi:hypothetical protein
MRFHYQSGEEIQPGDQVLLDGTAGEVEFVADPDAEQMSLYVAEFGAGVMVAADGVSGKAFFSEPENEPDLEFVARAERLNREPEG